MNYHKDNGLLNMIRRTDPMISEDGALKWDTAKGLSLINYNHFNTPKRVQFANGSCTEYEYSATGEKLRTIYRTAVPNITVPYGSTIALNSSNTLSVDSVNYFGEFVFENGQMSKYLFSGGYATISNGQPTFHYYVQDHLGNNRAVINHKRITGSVLMIIFQDRKSINGNVNETSNELS